MAKVEKFEDLHCWQAARELVRMIYQLCEQGKLSKDFDTRSQLRRAALSTMNNIAEGFGRSSNREFIRFLEMSQSSSMEVRSMTYVLSDLQYLDENQIKEIQESAEKTKSLTLGLIRYLRSKTSCAPNSLPS